MEFNTKRLPVARDDVAPDGSDMRVLLGVGYGGKAHFELGPSRTSGAVAHKTVEEIWYVLSGRGRNVAEAGGKGEDGLIEPDPRL